MGELKILGAQRVKALLEILGEKEKIAIAELRKKLPKDKDIIRMVDEEFGLIELRQSVEDLDIKLTEQRNKLTKITGESNSTRYGYGSSDTSTAWYKRYLELHQQLVSNKIEELRADYKKKTSDLWLCETLEQAKAIVGIR